MTLLILQLAWWSQWCHSGDVHGNSKDVYTCFADIQYTVEGGGWLSRWQSTIVTWEQSHQEMMTKYSPPSSCRWQFSCLTMIPRSIVVGLKLLVIVNQSLTIVSLTCWYYILYSELFHCSWFVLVCSLRGKCKGRCSFDQLPGQWIAMGKIRMPVILIMTDDWLSRGWQSIKDLHLDDERLVWEKDSTAATCVWVQPVVLVLILIMIIFLSFFFWWSSCSVLTLWYHSRRVAVGFETIKHSK